MDRETFMLAMAEILDVERDTLREETALDSDNWDSLSHMAAISIIDERFGVTVPANELVSVRTVGQLRDLVEGINS